MAEAERGYTMNVLEKILGEIEELKRNQDSKNQDFVTGYISALSTVEGVIAGLDEAKDINVPSNDGWIPVEKKLPEVPEENPIFDNKPLELYLVDIGAEYPIRAFWNGSDFTDGWTILKAIAWQPLPEPYKGGDDRA